MALSLNLSASSLISLGHSIAFPLMASGSLTPPLLPRAQACLLGRRLGLHHHISQQSHHNSHPFYPPSSSTNGAVLTLPLPLFTGDPSLTGEVTALYISAAVSAIAAPALLIASAILLSLRFDEPAHDTDREPADVFFFFEAEAGFVTLAGRPRVPAVLGVAIFFAFAGVFVAFFAAGFFAAVAVSRFLAVLALAGAAFATAFLTAGAAETAAALPVFIACAFAQAVARTASICCFLARSATGIALAAFASNTA